MLSEKNILCRIAGQRPPPRPIPRSISESDEVELQADKQHSTSREEQVWSGGLIGEGTRWLVGKSLCLGASLWRASHSTSHLQPKSDLSY